MDRMTADIELNTDGAIGRASQTVVDIQERIQEMTAMTGGHPDFDVQSSDVS